MFDKLLSTRNGKSAWDARVSYSQRMCHYNAMPQAGCLNAFRLKFNDSYTVGYSNDSSEYFGFIRICTIGGRRRREAPVHCCVHKHMCGFMPLVTIVVYLWELGLCVMVSRPVGGRVHLCNGAVSQGCDCRNSAFWRSTTTLVRCQFYYY